MIQVHIYGKYSVLTSPFGALVFNEGMHHNTAINKASEMCGLVGEQFTIDDYRGDDMRPDPFERQRMYDHADHARARVTRDYAGVIVGSELASMKTIWNAILLTHQTIADKQRQHNQTRGTIDRFNIEKAIRKLAYEKTSLSDLLFLRGDTIERGDGEVLSVSHVGQTESNGTGTRIYSSENPKDYWELNLLIEMGFESFTIHRHQRPFE